MMVFWIMFKMVMVLIVERWRFEGIGHGGDDYPEGGQEGGYDGKSDHAIFDGHIDFGGQPPFQRVHKGQIRSSSTYLNFCCGLEF